LASGLCQHSVFERFVDRPVSGESANCFVRHFFLARGLDRQVQPGLTPPAHLSPCIQNPPVSLSVCVCVCVCERERESVCLCGGTLVRLRLFSSSKARDTRACIHAWTHTHTQTHVRACMRTRGGMCSHMPSQGTQGDDQENVYARQVSITSMQKQGVSKNTAGTDKSKILQKSYQTHLSGQLCNPGFLQTLQQAMLDDPTLMLSHC
jgi:hypothetical protein